MTRAPLYIVMFYCCCYSYNNLHFFPSRNACNINICNMAELIMVPLRTSHHCMMYVYKVRLIVVVI